MVFAGTRKIHDRIHWTTIGNLVELLSNMIHSIFLSVQSATKLSFFSLHLLNPGKPANKSTTLYLHYL